MGAHSMPTGEVVRFPPRLRVMPAAPSALDALLSAGTIDDRQHAAGLAYGRLRRRYEDGIVWARLRRSPMSDDAWQAVKRDHAALIRAAGAERFMLDRLCLDDDAPMACDVERVREVLRRVRISLLRPCSP